MKYSSEINERIRQIQTDHEHGAVYLAQKALDIMALAAEEHVGENPKEMLKAMWHVGKRLIEIRPSMSAPIINAVISLWHPIYDELLSGLPICPMKGFVREKAGQIIRQMNRDMENAAKHTGQFIPENSSVFLFSYSSSVMAVMTNTASKKIKVIVAESRPLCEGVRTAQECAKLGIETTLITDAQTGLFIKDCSLVLVGADAILPNGDVVNKAGTSLVASIAFEYKIPFYVITTSWKIHPERTIVLEEKSPEEILTGNNPFSIRNIYFDITPDSKITSIITEKGSLSPSQISSLSIPIQKSYKFFLSNPLSA